MSKDIPKWATDSAYALACMLASSPESVTTEWVARLFANAHEKSSAASDRKLFDLLQLSRERNRSMAFDLAAALTVALFELHKARLDNARHLGEVIYFVEDDDEV